MRLLPSLALLLLCTLGVVVADVAVRSSILAHLRPVVITPRSAAVVRPPVEVEWDGPRQMRVYVRPSGGAAMDAGLHTSPAELPAAFFPREGSYELELVSPTFGGWIRAQRKIQVYFASPATASAAPTPTPASRRERPEGVKDLLRALKAARVARDRANERAKFLADENAALREESERLARQLETLTNQAEGGASEVEALERQVSELSEQNRAMAEELNVLRWRLASLPPCFVWGYYSFPRPNTYPATRRVVVISNLAGQIFRNQAECEVARRLDATAGSLCFCASSPWS